MISADRSTVTYTCETGYTLNGNQFRWCLDAGAGWNGTDPSCGMFIMIFRTISGTLNESPWPL